MPKKYLKKPFKQTLPAVNLPTDKTRLLQRAEYGKIKSLELNPAACRRFDNYCLDQKVSISGFFLAAFAVLISKLSYQDEFRMGVLTDRQENLKLPVMIKDNWLFSEIIKKNGKLIFSANKNNPPENLKQRVENVLFQLNGQAGFRSAPKNIQMISNSGTLNGKQKADYDLKCTVEKLNDGRINIYFEYNANLFYEETILRWRDYYLTLVTSFLENPKIKIANCEMLPEKERRWQIEKFNRTKAKYPDRKSIFQLVQEQARKTPDKTAVVFQDKCFSYADVIDFAGKLSSVLLKRGVKKCDIVAVLLERSENIVMVDLGILNSRAACLPIDDSYPANRIISMLENAKIKSVITSRAVMSKFADSLDFKKYNLLLIDELDWSQLKTRRYDNFRDFNSDETAYIIYTSGSTGAPKGIMLAHKGIVNHCIFRKKKMAISGRDTLAHLFSVSFINSIVHIYTPLMSGAKLIIYSRENLKNPITLFKIADDFCVTIMHVVSSALRFFIDSIDENDNRDIKLKKMRILIAASESTAARTVNCFYKYFQHIQLIHGCGQSEYSGICLMHDLSFGVKHTVSPIGRPIANTQVYILDSQRKLAPFGAPGELYISGDGLAKGYLNNKEKTRAAFWPHPFLPGKKIYRTGDIVRFLPGKVIVYLHRVDHQVKIGGCRVELGEIESVLSRLFPDLKQCIVVAKKDFQEETNYLAAYFTAPKKINADTMRKKVLTELPSYMAPSCFVQLEKMPTNQNGKIDRNNFPDPKIFLEKKNKTAKRLSSTNEKLLLLWQRILKIKNIGMNDNFFNLGGNSFKLTRLNNEINKELNIDIDLAKLFQFPTISGLASYLSGKNLEINDRTDKIESGKRRLNQIINRKRKSEQN